MPRRQRHLPRERGSQRREARRPIAGLALLAALLSVASGCARFPLPFVDRDATADAPGPAHDASTGHETTTAEDGPAQPPDLAPGHETVVTPLDMAIGRDGESFVPDTTGMPEVSVSEGLLPSDGPSCSPATWDPPVGLCKQPCNQTGPDQDCDGLPNARDPLPSTCQPGLLAEDFAKDPSKNPARWTLQMITKVTWSCGQAKLAADANLTLAHPNLLASTTTGPYLVETRFTLGSAADPKNWSVGIQVGLTTGAKFQCEAVMISGIGPITRPSTHLRIQGCGQDSGTWDVKPPDLGQGAVGESYLLQFWYDTQAHCRLLFDDKGSFKLQSQRSGYTCAVTRPDTFSVYTSKRAATLHTIRAFAFPN